MNPNDISNPLHPFSPVNPMNPLSPISPFNPANPNGIYQQSIQQTEDYRNADCDATCNKVMAGSTVAFVIVMIGFLIWVLRDISKP